MNSLACAITPPVTVEGYQMWKVLYTVSLTHNATTFALIILYMIFRRCLTLDLSPEIWLQNQTAKRSKLKFAVIVHMILTLLYTGYVTITAFAIQWSNKPEYRTYAGRLMQTDGTAVLSAFIGIAYLYLGFEVLRDMIRARTDYIHDENPACVT